VKFVGEVSPERIPELLRECTVGVLPTRRDVFLDFAFPNKLAELVVMGKPAIVSRLKAIRTYFSEGAMAFFAPNDPADLARRMVEVYQDAELRDFMARRARLEYVGIRWDVMKDRYLTIVDSLANRTHARALRPQDRVA